jgi:hypothetical protein
MGDDTDFSFGEALALALCHWRRAASSRVLEIRCEQMLK